VKRPDAPVALAAIAGAHGVSGEVRLKLFAAGLDSLRQHRRFLLGNREIGLVSLRDGPRGPIARLAGIDSRDAAEALRGDQLAVPRAELPPLAPGEVYWCDLVGLAVVTPDGAPAGEVVGVANYGASDILEIRLTDGREVLVPFTREAVPDVGDPLVIGPEWLAP
jgi:16S rRNA processing protein RimM